MFLSVVLPFSSRFWLLAFCFGCFCAEEKKQPKQNASSQNREENGSTTLRNTREKPLLAGYVFCGLKGLAEIFVESPSALWQDVRQCSVLCLSVDLLSEESFSLTRVETRVCYICDKS